MLKKTWRRSSSPAMWAVALVVSAPALVQAQTQLFPLAPIKRERVPCPMEDPIYGLYRHQYFGYFPTCWRTFPPGWGCPSPEAPNAALEFQRRKRDPLPENPPEPDEGRGPAPIPGEEPGMQRPGRTPMPPLPPGERSPFDIDRPSAPNAPNPPGGRAPEPEKSGEASPRDDGTGSPPVAPASVRNDRPQEASGEKDKEIEASDPVLGLPDPAEAPANSAPSPSTSTSGPDIEPLGQTTSMRGTAGGAPTAATAAMPPLARQGVVRPAMNPAPPPSSAGYVLAPTAAAPVSMPVQAPQRRGPLSTLFSGISSRLRR
jgi:hypothetical protein